MTSKIKAKLTISRRYGSDETRISISVTCASSRVEFLEIEMTPEDFGNAVTGLSSITVDAEVRGLDLVGKTRERREEVVEVNLPSHGKNICEPLILDAAKQFEVDGWKAGTYTALNTQGGKMLIQGTKDLYRCRVELVRWVDQDRAAIASATGSAS